jgi:hypothetical protein
MLWLARLCRPSLEINGGRSTRNTQVVVDSPDSGMIDPTDSQVKICSPDSLKKAK